MGVVPVRHLDGLRRVPGDRDQLEVILTLDELRECAAREFVVLGDQDADGAALDPNPRLGHAGEGSVPERPNARTRKEESRSLPPGG